MKLTGRRESTNVDDRRGMSAAKMGGIGGIGGIIIALLLTFLSKGNLDLTDIVSNVGMMGNVTEQAEGGREFTAEEQELAKFSKQILAGTEDVWAEEFKKLHVYYTTRPTNPLKKMQSLIVIACKILRVIFTILRTGQKYDPIKLLNDIKHIEKTAVQAA